MSYHRSANIQGKVHPVLAGLHTLCAVDETVDPGKSFVHPSLSHLTIHFTEKGNPVTRVDGQSYYYRPGSLIVMARGVELIEDSGSASPWQARYLMAAGPCIDALQESMAKRGTRVLFFDPAPMAWQRGLRECVEIVHNQPPGWPWLINSRFSGLIWQILEGSIRNQEHTSLLERIQSIVDRAPDQSWPLQALADAVKTSPSTLSHRWKVLTGQSPAAWVRIRRIEAARRLLRQGLPVNVVSDRMGFANPYHFSRIYKQVTGHMPSSDIRLGTTLH